MVPVDFTNNYERDPNACNFYFQTWQRKTAMDGENKTETRTKNRYNNKYNKHTCIKLFVNDREHIKDYFYIKYFCVLVINTDI